MAISRKHIDKVFGQKFSFLDQKMLMKYFDDKEQNEETKLVIKEQWEQFDPGPGAPPNLDHVFYKLYYTINHNRKEAASKRPRLFLRLSQIAAILITGVLIAIGIYFSNKGTGTASNQQVEFISHSGFRNQFRLPDGTTGWLGYDSELKYHVNCDNQRIAELDGLAFFDVAHQKEQPFIVKTPAQLDIEVLGTMFNVSSYAKDKTFEVVLEQGRVKLNLPDQKVQNMLPSERVIYHVENNSIEKTKVSHVEDFLAWKDGKLTLNDVSLKETCLKLSRFYHVEFELQAIDTDNQKIRLNLEDETLEDALNLLTMISPVTWQVEGRKTLGDMTYSKKKVIIKNK
ncbi:MAG: hypothetical protein A2W90_18785 [Bacteroidetes bacterium GWF2_42_66]|nr:MAG: hypothetical protein A2W92_05590 [Bacteroidetes bacterium GWA2_42_15]OFX98779.1 MAG: hypothetical protein A2W89_10910 [Bacteroidetes bacterium GWE2_42_39]OFY43024.1 MAG: hypothetical protein A2W90_18785 [Bacteroidetes bacterium GWF2_42_66]HBL77139.1 hypothetical protein [Prolixibacteraceae bacterium]HCR91430.1 hypothetical protein [Prolixibacteraceae bacterium]